MMIMNYRVLLFYKYVNVNDPQKFQKEHLGFCFANDIKGRVFVADEGINGTVSVTVDNIEKYKAHLTNFEEFNDIWFKEDEASEHAFRKIHVRVKKEIVNSDVLEVDFANGGKRLMPDELNHFYETGKDFIIVDARNNYESVIGNFKNSFTPDMDTFRDWKEVALQLADQKDKTVVTYCTGGIRCEKASAYLVEQGFKDVYQLEGGIVNYTKQYPDKFWQGSIFVFDERRIVEPNMKEDLRHTAECYYCGKPTSYYINCHNQNCDKLLISCHDCKVENEYCCSNECRASDNKRKAFHG
jgi:UPF0176 protein